MPAADRPISATLAEPVLGLAPPLIGALQSLYRAFQKTSIYPPGHPAIPQALGEAVAGFEVVLEERDDVFIGVTRGELRVDGEPLVEAGETVSSLAGLLYDLGVAGLEFHTGLTLAELERFTHELGRAKRDGVKGAALVEAMETLRLGSLRLRAVDYAALRFDEGSRQPLDNESRQQVLENVSRILSDPESAPIDLSPKELATEVTQQIRQREGTGVGLLKEGMLRLNRGTESLTPAQRERLRTRISSFVSALSPKLRRDLLRIDPRIPGESLELMIDLAEDLPESDLLRALRELDHMGARVPGQLLTLLNKLVRISRKQPTLAAGLRERLASWGVSADALSGSPGDLQDALQEVFQRRERADFYIPRPHKMLLDDLSRSHIDTAGFDIDDRYRDPRNMHDVRLHAAQIAIRLVGGRGAERHRAGILAFLASATDSLVEHGQFGVVHDAAVSARTYGLLRSESEETRRAARGFLDEFLSPRRVQKILEHGCTAEGFSKDALTLLGLGGSLALDRVLDFLDMRPPRKLAELLEEYVRTRDPALLSEVLDARLQRGWAALKSMLPLIGGLEPKYGVPLLEKLVSHEEPRVRRQALAALCNADLDPAALHRFLKRALTDKSPRVVSLAIQRLIGLDDPDTIRLLGAYIEDDLKDVTPEPDSARRAARSLLVKSEPGVTRLCLCLERLSRSPAPRRVRLARVVAETLRALRDDKAVARRLRRWRLSPSGLVHLVLPRAARPSGRTAE